MAISILNSVKIYNEHKTITYLKNENNKENIENDKIFNFSRNGKNVFVLIFDMAVSSYWNDAFNRFPEYKEMLDGFVYYNNIVSFSAHTTSIASLHGGYDYLPYELSTNYNYNLSEKHNEALLLIPLSLVNYDYKSSILNPAFVNFANYPDLKLFNSYSNIRAYNNDLIADKSISAYFGNNIDREKLKSIEQKNIAIRFSIFRMLPINLRFDFYDDKGWFNIYSTSINSGVETYALLNYTTNIINISEYGNYYNILHNDITHNPNFFGYDYLPHNPSMAAVTKEDVDIYGDTVSPRFLYVSVSSLNIMLNIIDFLKRNNIYDNTKIILVSDHATPVKSSSFKGKGLDFACDVNALLMYKDFNSNGELKIDTNFMTVADVPYLATKHIPNIKNPFNGKIITNDYKTNGANIIVFNSWLIDKQPTNRYYFDIFYNVKDNIFDINNWKKFYIDWNTKESKEIELK